ncbi:MAG: hypothetical protein U0325_09025 [Polyangiales bacterium]
MRNALLLTLTLLGCGGREIPRGVMQIDVPTSSPDIVFAPLDRTATPADDIADLDVPSVIDGGDGATPSDAARADVVDAPPADVPPPINRLCAFDESQVNAVAVKLATCFRVPPQTMMDRLWRPDTWEGGQLYTNRVCDVFRLCVALAATRGCPAVLATCMKMSLTPAPDNRCDGLAPACSGVRLRTCADGVIREDSCQASMRECVSTGGEGACVQIPSAPCTPGAAPRCEGDVLQRCVAGRWVSDLDCGRTGARCDAANARCVGTGAPCNDQVARCDGTVLIRCRGGREHRQDCGLNVRGASCRSMGGEAFCGVATECDPLRTPSTGTRKGRIWRSAGAGAYRFNCGALGFGGCGSSGCEP